jgi:predicted ArsR family transcriptional regulator
MVDWWSETEHAIVECLESAGPMSPEDLAHRVDISEGEATSFLCMLAREKKITIRLVGLSDEPASQSPRGESRQAAYAGGH